MTNYVISDEKAPEPKIKTVYDVSIHFYGLTGRQRKVQSQHLRIDELETKPSDAELEEMVKEKLREERARNIHNSWVKGTVFECEVKYERGYQSKTFEVFGDKNTSFGFAFSG